MCACRTSEKEPNCAAVDETRKRFLKVESLGVGVG